jgi:hypothetical protein
VYIIERVRSDTDGSLTAEINTSAGVPAGWQEAMVISGANQSVWHYESAHWTSTELLDDGINKKTDYFNVANRVKIPMHFSEAVCTRWWSVVAHNLGMSLHQIFATNTFVASNAPLKDWHNISGDGVAG